MALLPSGSPSNPSSPAAAREAAQQDGFLREIDEALREDQVRDLFVRWGKPLGGVIAAGLLAFGGYLWWDHSREAAAGERAEAMTQVLDKLGSGPGAAADADKALLPLATSGSDGSKAVAASLRAALPLQSNNADEAIKRFAAIADDASLPQPYRDLATIRRTALEYGKIGPAAVIARLKPMAIPGNPWFGSAAELVGMAYLDQNRPDLAGPLLASAGADKDVPESLRGRLAQLASELGAESPAAAPR